MLLLNKDMSPMFGDCIWLLSTAACPRNKHSDSILRHDRNTFYKTVASVHVEGNIGDLQQLEFISSLAE